MAQTVSEEEDLALMMAMRQSPHFKDILRLFSQCLRPVTHEIIPLDSSERVLFDEFATGKNVEPPLPSGASLAGENDEKEKREEVISSPSPPPSSSAAGNVDFSQGEDKEKLDEFLDKALILMAHHRQQIYSATETRDDSLARYLKFVDQMWYLNRHRVQANIAPLMENSIHNSHSASAASGGGGGAAAAATSSVVVAAAAAAASAPAVGRKSSVSSASSAGSGGARTNGNGVGKQSLSAKNISNGTAPLSTEKPSPKVAKTASAAAAAASASAAASADANDDKKKNKLDPHSVKILYEWFAAHIQRPYPTENEKELLAVAANITLKQVGNWFVNVRKRSWFRLLEEACGSERARDIFGSTHSLVETSKPRKRVNKNALNGHGASHDGAEKKKKKPNEEEEGESEEDDEGNAAGATEKNDTSMNDADEEEGDAAPAAAEEEKSKK